MRAAWGYVDGLLPARAQAIANWCDALSAMVMGQLLVGVRAIGMQACEIMTIGPYHSNPCRYPTRPVSVWWQGRGSHSLTNVLDPQALSACQDCKLSRRRLADAFARRKPVVDVAAVAIGSANAVPLQFYAMLIFYAVLLTICQQGTQVLGELVERSRWRWCLVPSIPWSRGSKSERTRFVQQALRKTRVVPGGIVPHERI